MGSGQLNFEETYDETVDDIYRIIIERIEYILISAYPSRYINTSSIVTLTKLVVVHLKTKL